MTAKVRSFVAICLFSLMILSACVPKGIQSPATTSEQVPATRETETALLTSTKSVHTTPTSLSGSSPGSDVTYFLDSSQSEASYAVREQLARLDFPSDAIGKTKAISGMITLNQDGSIDQANSKFTVDLSTLQSDENKRDGYVSRNILQTIQYPQAVFVPTQVTGLPEPMSQSGSHTFQMTGDMTIRDVTKPITWDVTANFNNGEITGTATTSFKFEDFNLNQPRVPVVLSVVDNITLNVNFVLQSSQNGG
jgi:polyisoprenoid-binding protein YceI